MTEYSLNQDGKDRFSLALVTGSTSGIGLALCRLLAKQGIDLIIHGRDEECLNSLVTELEGDVNVVAVQADLNKPEDLSRVVQAIVERQPDLVINNAGFGLYGEILGYPTDQQMEILQVNGNATVKLTIEAARTLIANERKGTILNLSSAASFFVFPGFSVYSAAKAMLNQFSESFDEETKPYGVRVLVACPGKVVTNFRERAGGKPRLSGDSEGDMSPEFAAEQIWRQILKGQKLHIFDWRYRFGTFMSRYILPKALIVWFLKRVMKKTKASAK